METEEILGLLEDLKKSLGVRAGMGFELICEFSF